MALRKVPGALALGLFASLGAHAALYGGEHAIGGAYHALLVQIALAAALVFVVLIGALAWAQSGSSTDGKYLPPAFASGFPAFGSVIAAAGAWYVGVEAIEPHHAGAPGIALLAALAAASYAALRLAHRDNRRIRARRHRHCPHVLLIAYARVATTPARPPDRTSFIFGTSSLRASSSDHVCFTARVIARKALSLRFGGHLFRFIAALVAIAHVHSYDALDRPGARRLRRPRLSHHAYHGRSRSERRILAADDRAHPDTVRAKQLLRLRMG